MTNAIPKPSDVLRAALAMFKDGLNWYRVSDPASRKQAADSPTCASNMLSYASLKMGDKLAVESEARNYLIVQVGASRDDLHALFDWNDAAERTWPDVRNAFERAIAQAEAEGR